MLAHFALCLALTPQVAPPPATPATPTHTEMVTTNHPLVAFATDGKLKTMYGVTSGKELRAWRMKNGKPIWTTDGLPPTELGCHLAVGKDTLVASLGGLAAYTPYDLKTGRPSSGQAGITAMQKCNALAIDPRDRWIWIGTDNGSMTRLTPGNLNAWSNRAMKNGGVTAIALDDKAKLLAVGGKDGTVQFLNSKSAKRDKDKKLEGHDGAVSAIAWGPKNKLVLSASGSKVLVHSMKSEKVKATFGGHEGDVQHIAVHPAGKWITSADDKGIVALWNLADGEELVRFEIPEAPSGIVGLVVLDKGAQLLSAAGTKVLAWDVSEFGK